MSKLIAATFLDEKKVKLIHQVLQEKILECELFLKRKEQLELLCQHVDVPVEGEILS